MKYYMVFDVESIGLQGPAFAFGYVILDNTFTEVASGIYMNKPNFTLCNPDDVKWVKENVPFITFSKRNIHEVFNEIWKYWKNKNAYLFAECCFPVETNFLSECVRYYDSPSPYPLYDIASIRFAKGYDPLKEVSRGPIELPKHNPLADARQSARLLKEALSCQAP